MRHFTLPRFWRLYRQAPEDVQRTADKNYELLQADPSHPSLHYKKAGQTRQLWSVRVGVHHRAIGREKPDGIVRFWIGTPADNDKLPR